MSDLNDTTIVDDKETAVVEDGDVVNDGIEHVDDLPVVQDKLAPDVAVEERGQIAFERRGQGQDSFRVGVKASMSLSIASRCSGERRFTLSHSLRTSGGISS